MTPCYGKVSQQGQKTVTQSEGVSASNKNITPSGKVKDHYHIFVFNVFNYKNVFLGYILIFACLISKANVYPELKLSFCIPLFLPGFSHPEFRGAGQKESLDSGNNVWSQFFISTWGTGYASVTHSLG